MQLTAPKKTQTPHKPVVAFCCLLFLKCENETGEALLHCDFYENPDLSFNDRKSETSLALPLVVTLQTKLK